jgi:hypothetical protein
MDMCTNGTGAQCRSYFVVLSLNGYATHAIFDDHEKCRFVFMDYITYQGSYLTDFLQCPPNEEHEHFQLYFEFTSVINSVVSGGDVVNLKKLNTLYRSNENLNKMKVNTITTQWTNEYIFNTFLQLT